MRLNKSPEPLKKRTVAILLVVLVSLTAILVIESPRIAFWQLTGHSYPIKKVDTLTSIVAVSGWTEVGLRLADGRMIQLPGFRRLPKTSAALTEVVRRGVEIDAAGRVYGLIRIHHWCGNDPVREHIAKVDVAKVLAFLQEGDRTSPAQEGEVTALRAGGTFSEWGWNVSEFSVFQAFAK
jgi:hypothetical protein